MKRRGTSLKERKRKTFFSIHETNEIKRKSSLQSLSRLVSPISLVQLILINFLSKFNVIVKNFAQKNSRGAEREMFGVSLKKISVLRWEFKKIL